MKAIIFYIADPNHRNSFWLQSQRSERTQRKQGYQQHKEN